MGPAVLMYEPSVGGSGCTIMTRVPPRVWAEVVSGLSGIPARATTRRESFAAPGTFIRSPPIPRGGLAPFRAGGMLVSGNAQVNGDLRRARQGSRDPAG